MNLEEKLKQKQVIRRIPSDEVMAHVEKGNRFIAVDEQFDLDYVPEGYTLIDMRHKDDSFKALIPQSLLFYMANPGEGDSDDALDEISDFYGDAENYEDDMIESGQRSVQETNWATLARSAYETYLINKLVARKSGAKDDDGEPVPEFNPETLRQIDIDDPYVAQRIRAVSALALGETEAEIKKYDIADVLKHVTVQASRTKQLTREEFKEVTCWAGSHYQLKDEYMNRDDIEYKIESRHDKDHMAGVREIKQKKVEVLDSKIEELEKEIADYRSTRRGTPGRHDAALLRQYANLAYIAPENPKAQLDIAPPSERQKNG